MAPPKPSPKRGSIGFRGLGFIPKCPLRQLEEAIGVRFVQFMLGSYISLYLFLSVCLRFAQGLEEEAVPLPRSSEGPLLHFGVMG